MIHVMPVDMTGCKYPIEDLNEALELLRRLVKSGPMEFQETSRIDYLARILKEHGVAKVRAHGDRFQVEAG